MNLAGRRENEGWGTKSAWTKTLDFRPSRVRPSRLRPIGRNRIERCASCVFACLLCVCVCFSACGCWFLLVSVGVGAGLPCGCWFHVWVLVSRGRAPDPPSARPLLPPDPPLDRSKFRFFFLLPLVKTLAACKPPGHAMKPEKPKRALRVDFGLAPRPEFHEETPERESK